MSLELTLETILDKYQIMDLSKLPQNMVGPVLMKDEFSYAVVEALARDNPNTFKGVLDRGSYIRVVGERELILNKTTLEEVIGMDVRFPGEVEVRMSAFAGKIIVRGDYIKWHLDL
ncbi:toluene monooxygenase [Saccharolobus solfataricus]|uniref:Toluene-4-monooxygenase system protein D. (TmoD) n=3 Tax=Saccharolobus solfataricus TaxID=2287 RepID=Q97YS7_SACS2|nr:MmoB/DmpM family protein [Saccharolobus solfataricus]ABP35949.1 multicomponent monooxygenase system protein D [Saccharolobus solfataricus 98/2]AAK41477.1 Toluene-4-monooxygenase system protein D. (tmoD) [Saccharolobus solfataricus P2]AKA74411.1 toluene monooxygenase [Saccharolobus solfataricus]AKA77106.1 toluene monooxygenase [Saccharolobus solfataricus]AKA79799.1 toluene monooxygenase [Saccharolobus solfataricus]